MCVCLYAKVRVIRDDMWVSQSTDGAGESVCRWRSYSKTRQRSSCIYRRNVAQPPHTLSTTLTITGVPSGVGPCGIVLRVYPSLRGVMPHCEAHAPYFHNTYTRTHWKPCTIITEATVKLMPFLTIPSWQTARTAQHCMNNGA